MGKDDLFDVKVGVFKNTESSSKCNGSRTIMKALLAIKDNPKKDLIVKARKSGKKNGKKPYTIYSYGQKIKANYYDFIKITGVPAVTWALSLEKGEVKRKADIADEKINGYIYYDIDSYDNCTLDEIKAVLQKAVSVIAVWKSFGGNGLGFLVHADNLTKETFASTWEHYKNKFEKFILSNLIAGRGENAPPVFLSLDPVTKDYTRLNILSYDPDIYISDLTKYMSLSAIMPSKTKVKRVGGGNAYNRQGYNSDIEVVECHLEYILEKWYNNEECFNHADNRLAYYFYQRYFSECNILGIEFDLAFDFILKSADDIKYEYLFSHRSEAEVEKIGRQQYTVYNSQFNSWIDNYEDYPEYTIENFNVKYEGTVQETNELLNYYYYATKKDYSSVNEVFVKKFTAKIKERGILRRTLIEFLLTKKIKGQLIDLAIRTYNIPYIPFGLVLKHTEEGKKNLRGEKIAKEERQGKKTIEIASANKIDNSFLKLIKKFENIYFFADFFFKKANSFFISKEDAINSFINDFKNDGLEILATTVCNEIYFNELPYVGLVFEKKTYNAAGTPFPKEYILNENQYISDLKIPISGLGENTIIWSDTNSGKTTFICSDNTPTSKKIVLVPVIPLLKSIENRHKVSVYYGLKKNVNVNSDTIICTYSSFPRLFGQLSDWGILERYELHIDEAHSFVASASKGYRNDEMNFILDKLASFKKTLLYTGTWIEFLSPQIKSFKTIRIKKPRKKDFKRVLYNDKLPCVEQLCNKERLNVIYLQSKLEERELGKYKKFFIEKGWDENKILFLNSTQKENPEFEYVITKEKIKEKYNLVFCTSIAAEGLNIKDITPYSLHFCTNESPHLIEQIVNRFRDNVPENIYLYKNKNKNTETATTYFNLNVVEYQEKKIAATEKLLSLVNHKDNIEFFKTLQNTDFIRFHNGQYEIDYLSIAYSAYEHEKAYANSNIAYMANILKEYGWEFKGDIILEDTIEKDMLKTLKAYRKAKGAQLDIERRNIFKEIKKNEDKETVELNISEEAMLHFQKNALLPDYEISIRKRLLYFARYMSWGCALDIVEYWVKDLKCSNTKLKTLIKQLLIIKQEKTGYFDNAVKIQDVFFERLKNKYLDDKRLDNAPAYLEGQLVNFVNKLGDGCDGFKEVDSFESAKNIIEKYFDLSAVIDKKGNIRYKFGAVKLANEAAEHYKKCKAFATYYGKSGLSFTKQDIRTYLLKIRKSLLYCAYYDTINEMNDTEALDILKMYCDVEHKGKGNYEVASIEPDIFKGIEWSFSQKNTNKKEEVDVLAFAS